MTIDVQPHAGIDELYSKWSTAIRAGDVDAVMNLLTPDYQLWPAGGEAVSRDALPASLAAALAAYDISPSFECYERVVSGDMAFERGWDVQTIRPRTGGAPQVRRQRVFLLLRCDDRGIWRFARGMSQPGPA